MGQIANTFKPTQKMFRFLEALLDPGVGPSIKAICQRACVSRTTYYRNWVKNPEFCKWLGQEYAKNSRYLMPILDKIAWEMCRKNYRYFEHLQRKYGVEPGRETKGLHDIVGGKWRPKLPDDLPPAARQAITGEDLDNGV